MVAWQESAPECRTALVTDSWMIRNGARSMSAGSSRRVPFHHTPTRTGEDTVVVELGAVLRQTAATITASANPT